MASTLIYHQPVKLPLCNPAFRNNNVASDFAEQGSGVTVMLRCGPGDYRAWNEVFNATQNHVVFYQSPNGIEWTETWRTLGPGSTVQAAMTPLSASAPDNNEVCANTVPFWSTALSKWVTYVHAGGNPGPRYSQMWTSPDLTSNNGQGTWSPDVIVFQANQTYEGTAQTAPHQLASDLKVRISGSSLVGYYRAGDNLTATAGMAKVTGNVSDPRTFTKQGVKLLVSTLSNSGSVGAAYAGMVSLEGHYQDDGGRLHVWFVGDTTGGVEAVCYAISDDELAFTPQYNGAGVIVGSGGTAADNIVVGQNSALDDGDLVILCYGGYNLTASYTPTKLGGDSLGLPLRGNSLAYVPAARNVAAARPGRHFTYVGTTAAAAGSATRQVLTSGSTAIRCLNQTAFSMYVEYKMPRQGVSRTLYAEAQAFNGLTYLNVDTSGKLNGFYRNGASIANPLSTSRVDDNTWRAGCFVRNSAASWTLYDEGGTVLASDGTTSPGTDATAPNISIGNWTATDASAGAMPDEPAFASIRRVCVLQGIAMSASDVRALWNSGNTGGALPAASASANTRDVRPGSGGTGNDTELLNSIVFTASNSPASVNAQPAPAPAFLAGAGGGDLTPGRFGRTRRVVGMGA